MQIVADRRVPFLVSHHGTIYEQDLGVDTDSITEDTVTFNADASRSPVIRRSRWDLPRT